MAINDGHCGHCGGGEFTAIKNLATCCSCGAQYEIVAGQAVPLPCSNPPAALPAGCGLTPTSKPHATSR
jgi:hypothetical protein